MAGPHLDRPFDMVVFGATSFAGQLLCRSLVERHGTDGGSTAKMLGEAAFALLSLERVGGGFWTLATAFGDSLIEPLEQHAGSTFEVLE